MGNTVLLSVQQLLKTLKINSLKSLKSHLLIKERPENRDRQEDVDDALQRLNVVDEGVAETALGVILKFIKKVIKRSRLNVWYSNLSSWSFKCWLFEWKYFKCWDVNCSQVNCSKVTCSNVTCVNVNCSDVNSQMLIV